MKTKDVAMGSIYAMSSRVVLMLSGFVLQIVLARKLGPELFGIYTLVISILLWAEYCVTMGIPSVFQKIISETRERIRLLVAAVGRYSVPYCFGIMLLFALASPLIAALLADDRLPAFLLVASLDIPVFGLYTTFICMLNGHGQFLLQSVLAAAYSVVRTIAIVAAVLLGFGITGALLGNAVGSLIGLVLAFYFTLKLSRQYAEPDSGEASAAYGAVRKRLLSFGLPFGLYHLCSSVLIHMDIWFVKALSGNEGPSAVALGYYAVAYNLARIPYFVITGISFTSFPAISKAYFENRIDDARELIMQMLRFMFIVLLPLNALVLASAEEMITFLFSDTYAPAADAFRVLFAGISIYTVFMYFMSTISAQNRPLISLLVALALVPVAVVLNYVLIPKLGIMGAAIATGTVSLVGVIAMWPYMHRKYGNLVDSRSLLRVLSLSVAIYFIASIDALYQVNLLVTYSLLGALYLAGLFIVRELDVDMVRAALPGGSRSSGK